MKFCRHLSNRVTEMSVIFQRNWKKSNYGSHTSRLCNYDKTSYAVLNHLPLYWDVHLILSGIDHITLSTSLRHCILKSHWSIVYMWEHDIIEALYKSIHLYISLSLHHTLTIKHLNITMIFHLQRKSSCASFAIHIAEINRPNGHVISHIVETVSVYCSCHLILSGIDHITWSTSLRHFIMKAHWSIVYTWECHTSEYHYDTVDLGLPVLILISKY